MNALLLFSVAMSTLLSPLVGHAVELIVNPDCPRPTDSISILAYQSVPPPSFPIGAPVVTRAGNSIKIVLGASHITFVPSPPSSGLNEIGPLPSGNYRVDLYLQFKSTEPEQLTASKEFTVQENPPACTPATLSAIRPFQTTTITNDFALPLRVLVTDATRRPVPNVPVHFARYSRPEDIIAPQAPFPDATLSSEVALTGGDGIAAVSGKANGVPGTFQYSAYVQRADVTLQTFFVLSNEAAPTNLPFALVVEFQNQGLGHYFITSNLAEMALLDDGVIRNWIRTGGVFLAFTPFSPNLPLDSTPVCRFYGLPEAHIDSHFFLPLRPNV